MKKHNRMSFRRLSVRARKLIDYCKRFNQSRDSVTAALELADLGPRSARFSVDVATSPHLDRVLGLSIMRIWHLIVSHTVIALDSPKTKEGAAACLQRARIGHILGSDSIEAADRMLKKIRAIRNNTPKEKRHERKKFSPAQELAWLQKHADN